MGLKPRAKAGANTNAKTSPMLALVPSASASVSASEIFS